MMKFIFAYLAIALLTTQAIASSETGMETIELKIVNIDDPEKSAVLTSPMKPVKFPISTEKTRFIDALSKLVVTKELVGLAATQVGVAEPITAYYVPKKALAVRYDVTEEVPLTVLINPSYEPIEEYGQTLDWEGCASGKQHYGKIWRWAAIKYKGQDINGNPVEGKAYGFLARLLQHEISHCNSKMCIHSYDPDSPQGTQEGLKPMRLTELAAKKEEMGLGKDDNFPFIANPLLN